MSICEKESVFLAVCRMEDRHLRSKKVVSFPFQ